MVYVCIGTSKNIVEDTSISGKHSGDLGLAHIS